MWGGGEEKGIEGRGKRRREGREEEKGGEGWEGREVVKEGDGREEVKGGEGRVRGARRRREGRGGERPSACAQGVGLDADK